MSIDDVFGPGDGAYLPRRTDKTRLKFWSDSGRGRNLDPRRNVQMAEYAAKKRGLDQSSEAYKARKAAGIRPRMNLRTPVAANLVGTPSPARDIYADVLEVVNDSSRVDARKFGGDTDSPRRFASSRVDAVRGAAFGDTFDPDNPVHINAADERLHRMFERRYVDAKGTETSRDVWGELLEQRVGIHPRSRNFNAAMDFDSKLKLEAKGSLSLEHRGRKTITSRITGRRVPQYYSTTPLGQENNIQLRLFNIPSRQDPNIVGGRPYRPLEDLSSALEDQINDQLGFGATEVAITRAPQQNDLFTPYRSYHPKDGRYSVSGAWRDIERGRTVEARQATQRATASETAEGRTVGSIVSDLHARGRAGVSSAYSSTGRTTRNAMDEAIEFARDMAAMSKEERKSVLSATLSPLRRIRDSFARGGLKGASDDATRAFTSFGKRVDGSLGSHDFDIFKSIIENLGGGPIDPVKNVMAKNILARMSDVRQLRDVAESIDAAKTAEVDRFGSESAKIARLRDIISKKLRSTTVNRFGEVHTVVTSETTKKSRFLMDQAKEAFGGWLNKSKNLANRYIKDEDRMGRARRHIFGADMGGMPSVKMIGKNGAKQRIFDMAGGQTLESVREGLGIVDKDGFVKPGVINSFGLDERALREMENVDLHFVGFELQPGRSLTTVFKQLASGRDKEGKLTLSNIAHLTAEMNSEDKRHLDALSKVAFHRTVVLDIETTHGKSSWIRGYGKLSESGGADAALGEMLHNIGTAKAQGLHTELLDAVRSRDSRSILEASKRLRVDEDVDWITQVAMQEQEHTGILGEANSAWRKTSAGVNVGRNNTGAMAARHLSDEDFEQVVMALVKESATQRRTGGGAIIGLNVNKFDLRVIREQAWRTGEEALAGHKVLQKALIATPIGGSEDAIRTAMETVGIALPKNVNRRAYAMRQSEILRVRAGRMLAYSGEWTGKGWIESEHAVAKAMRAQWKVGSSMADTLNFGDITSIARQFLTDSLGGEMSWTRSSGGSTAKARARMHILGNKNGIAEINGMQMKSQSVLAWGRDSDNPAARMKKVLGGVDEVEFNAALQKALKIDDADIDSLNRIKQGYFSWQREMLEGTPVNRLQRMNDVMGDFDEVRVKQELTRLRKLWGDAKVEQVHEKIIGSIASAESLLYTRPEAWRRFTGNRKFFEAAAHTSNRDLDVVKSMADESFRTAKQLGCFAVAAITDIPAELLNQIRKGGLGRGMQLFFAGYGGDGTKGAKGKYLGFDIIHPIDEALGEFEYRSLLSRVRGGVGAIGRVGAEYHDKVAKIASRTANELASSIGVVSDIAKIESRVDFGLKGVAGLTIAAAAIVAGTIYHRNHQDDNVWKYGETESPNDVKVRKMQRSDNSMGNMVTEMSKRKNYSYNQRQNKHKHLFGG